MSGPVYSDALREDRRSVILRVLHDQTSLSMSDSNIHDCIERGFGHMDSRDVVRDDLVWLEEHGLVQLEHLQGGHIWMARLLQRGEDCVTGRTKVHGVKRPGPR